MVSAASTLHTAGRRTITVAALLAGLSLWAWLAAPGARAATAVNIGANQEHLAGQASVAVDPAGTAYIAWPSAQGASLNFCKVALGASSCSPQQLTPSSGTTFPVADPSVLVEGSTVYVFAEAVSTDGDDSGMTGFVSTDGGATFTPLLGGAAISFGSGDGSATLDPVFALPGGNIGVSYVVPTENPDFQAVSLSSPTENSQTTHPTSEASLNPSPNGFQIGNLGGQVAPQLSGSEGILGAFELIETGPCPTTDGIDYAFASLPATDAALDTSTGGAGSAWQPQQLLECTADDPAVGGGPAGLGVLDENETNGTVVYHAFNAASKTFNPPELITHGHENEAALAQDAAGGVFATWVSGGDELELDYHSSGGSSWPSPKVLVSSGENDIGGASSSVNAAGQGWAAYTAADTEYALPFTVASFTGATETISQSSTLEGEHTTLSVPRECVRNGVINGTLTVKIPSHKRKGRFVVKIYRVIFSLGSVHKTVTRKKLSNAPFVATLHVPGLAANTKYVLSARAFIAVHHGPPRSKTLHVTITTCA
jgi:hypothetical protein